jgi:hypothetical protein
VLWYKAGFFAAYKAQRADFFRNLLVDPINNACSEVEWCQVPLIQVNLRVGDLAQANTKMMSRVKVEPTCDCPLAAKVFDWLRVFCSRNRWIQIPPRISGATKNGYVGREGPKMQRYSRPGKGRLLVLVIKPPLDGASDLNANQVAGLEEASYLVSKEDRGVVAEIWRDIDGQRAKYRQIRFPNEPWNYLG